MLRNSIIFSLILITGISCSKEKTGEQVLPPDNNSVLKEWIKELAFDRINITGVPAGYKDLVFNEDNAAALDSRNIISFTYDNGNTWNERITLSGNTFTCIALKPDGSKLFIGGISHDNYTFGAKFWVYNTPKNGEVSADYDGEAQISNTNEPITNDFMRTIWNGDGSVYASFGRTGYKDGFFGNITPDGRTIFIRRTPSFSYIQNKTPPKFPTHCQGFVINDASKTLTLSAYEYIPTGNINMIATYTSYDGGKGAGNSWTNITNYWKAGLAKHMACNKNGSYTVIVGDAGRFL